MSVFRNLKSGLIAEVYGNSAMRPPLSLSCLDSDVDYAWGSGAIAPSCAENESEVASDFVSIRWTGFVLLDVVETVTFFVETAPAADGIDGAKLWIEGILIVDTTISNEIQSGTIIVSAAASLYSVLLEFRASTGTCTHCFVL